MRAKIDRLGMNGEGIFNIPEGEDKGKIAFVDFALPEEIIECDIIKNNSKFCKCKLNSVEKKSKNRIEPKCKYYYICGGCDLQHMNDEMQSYFKKKKILDALSDICDIRDVELIRRNKFNYRNKMVFPFNYNDDTIELGMFEKESHDVVAIDECMLASENINKVLHISQKYFKKESKKFIQIIDKIKLKYLVIREINNSILVAIVTNKKYDFKEYYDYIKKSFGSIGLSVVVNKNSKEILAGDYYHLYGIKDINLNEFGIDYSIDIMSFLQVNNEIKSELYKRVLDNINIDDIVIDAYSGAGLMSAIIAKKCNRVIGIEINKFAHSKANDLAKVNNICNLINICGDANILLENQLKKSGASTLVLDPARNGCGNTITEYLSKSIENLPQSIIYVSCNLATLRRDLLAIKNNYDIKYVCGFDMFPQTKHVETLVCLQRKV